MNRIKIEIDFTDFLEDNPYLKEYLEKNGNYFVFDFEVPDMITQEDIDNDINTFHTHILGDLEDDGTLESLDSVDKVHKFFYGGKLKEQVKYELKCFVLYKANIE